MASLTGVTPPALAKLYKLVRGLQLMPETLFLTMNLIDRFLEARSMTRKNLQLVGAMPGAHSAGTCLHGWWRCAGEATPEIVPSVLSV